MKNVKFWLAQIAMVAMVSLIFGSPVFAGQSNNTKGVDTKRAHAADNAKINANEKSGLREVGETDVEETVVEETVVEETEETGPCVIDPNDILGSCL